MTFHIRRYPPLSLSLIILHYPGKLRCSFTRVGQKGNKSIIHTGCNCKSTEIRLIDLLALKGCFYCPPEPQVHRINLCRVYPFQEHPVRWVGATAEIQGQMSLAKHDPQHGVASAWKKGLLIQVGIIFPNWSA